MTIEIEGMTVAGVLRTAARERADEPFIHFGPETLSYRDIDDSARRLGNCLVEAGVTRGDLVGIMMNNCVEFIEVYAALVYRGAAIVLINPEFRGYMLEYVVNDAACTVIVADAVSVEELRRSSPRMESLTTVLTVADLVGETEEALAVHRLFRSDNGLEPEEAVGPRDLHCIVYSSGTTGPSKGIMLSNAHALAKALEVIRICDFTGADILYSPLPLFYSMGLLRGVLSVALVGASVVLREKFSVSHYWKDVRRHSATVAHSVFSLPVMLESQPTRPDDRMHTLSRMFNARHSPAFEKRFGVRLIEGYGLTEAGNAIYSRLNEAPRIGSCGRVSDEWEVRLETREGAEADVGEAGEILLRPSVPHRIMLGYLNKPEVTVTATRDLWFHTGDIASRDADGFYYFKGRMKEMIRRRGQNISAWEVEKIVSAFPEVAETAAIAHPAAVGDEDVRVIVVPVSGTRIDLTLLAEHCERNMPPFMVPRYLEQRLELPKTPSGRIEKYKLSDSRLSVDVLDRGDRGAAR